MNSWLDIRSIGVILAGLWLLNPNRADADDAKSMTEIRTVLDNQAAAWNKGDLAGFMDGYWNSKDLTFFSGKDKRQGWEETFAHYKMRYQGEGKEMGQLTFSELDIKPLTDDYAVVKGRFHVEMKKEKLEGIFTLIMRKTDKGWKIIHDHTSS